MFSTQPDIQSIQQQMQALTDAVPLHYEAGGLPCSCIISLDANVSGWLSVPRRAYCCPWMLQVLTERSKRGMLLVQVEHIQDQEWLESIRDSYQPAQIAEGLWIIPSWCQPEDPSAVNITLEPGIAFGTGEHPTTRLCLKALLGLDLRWKLLMDYGTGEALSCITECAMEAGAGQCTVWVHAPSTHCTPVIDINCPAHAPD